MSFLTVNSVDYEVTTDGAQQGEPIRQGAVVRAFAGNARSTVRSVKRQWSFTVFFDDPADEATLRTATELGQAVTCTGDALAGASVSCIVTVGASDYLANLAATYGHWRAAAVALEEV